MKRRDFLSLTGAAALGAAFTSSGTAAALLNHKQYAYNELGVQLYTVRAHMQKDFKQPLKKIAGLGYKDVEFAGYFDHSPKEIKAFMNDIGLVSRASHVGIDLMRNDFDSVLEQAHTMGQKYIVLPWLSEEERKNIDKYKRHAELLNTRGEAAKKAGFQMAYHNHDFEFMTLEGQLPYDLLLRETDSDLVQMELDLYWVVKAGKDPIEYFKKAPGRYPLCHIKDKASDGSITTVGKGSIDFQAIFAHAKTAGLKHFYVEHDNTPRPFESLGYSYKQLFSA
jgi:sugar phosphate isomerase/epimerase